MTRIKHGFDGQRMIILPFYIVDEIEKNTLTNDLYVHSLGYFPNARHHYIHRPEGCPENILIYCIKGKGWFEVDGKRQGLAENQFVILQEQKPHHYEADIKQPWSIYWAHFKGNKTKLLEQYFNRAISVSHGSNSGIDDRLELFEEICNVLSDSYSPENLNYANMCFTHFLGTMIYAKTYSISKNQQHHGTSLINMAMHYMNENLEKKLKLDDIAQHFGYSTSHFYRLFYKDMGYAPMVYFTQLKILRACYFLQNTDFHIKQISNKLGFDDPYYFSRTFSRIMGMPPKDYRRQVCVK